MADQYVIVNAEGERTWRGPFDGIVNAQDAALRWADTTGQMWFVCRITEMFMPEGFDLDAFAEREEAEMAAGRLRAQAKRVIPS